MKKTYVIPQQRFAVLQSVDGLLQNPSVQIGPGTTEEVEVKAQEYERGSVWDDEW